MKEFILDFLNVFTAITLVVAYLVASLFIIVVPFVYIGGIRGVVLGIFAAVFFISMTVTLGDRL